MNISNPNRSIMTTLMLGHVFLISLSNILVQYPFQLFGFHTTWGAFSYPCIFILTDLTTRLTDAKTARRVIYLSMFPGLVLSYVISRLIESNSVVELLNLSMMPFRIAIACFTAYAIGQILDIKIFSKFRRNSTWWLAPSVSTTLGNMIDTLIFFSLAFYQCPDPFLSEHWPEIALVDLGFKILISLLALVPIYGIILNLAPKSLVTQN